MDYGLSYEAKRLRARKERIKRKYTLCRLKDKLGNVFEKGDVVELGELRLKVMAVGKREMRLRLLK